MLTAIIIIAAIRIIFYFLQELERSENERVVGTFVHENEFNFEVNNSLDLSVSRIDDKDGYYCDITSKNAIPKNSMLVIYILNHDSTSIIKVKKKSSVPDFLSDKNDFFCMEFPYQKRFFIPFGVLDYPKSGEYNLVISVVSPPDAQNEFNVYGLQYFSFTLPAPRNWYRSEFFRPLIGAMMTIARLDGNLNGEYIKVLRDILEGINVPKDEDNILKEIIKSEPSTNITELILNTKNRCPGIDGKDTFDILVDFSRKCSLLSPKHLNLLDDIAKILGVSTEEIKDLGSTIKNHYEVLGVNETASLDDIRRAYRLKMKDFHPDKYVNAPKEFQDLAHTKSIEIRESYECLIKLFSK